MTLHAVNSRIGREYVVRRLRAVGVALGIAAALVAGRGWANDQPTADDVTALRTQAVAEALASAAPSIVQIETVGGDERVEGQRVAVGPTTGVVVRQDGLIVTSAFNFVHNPSAILVTLPDGRRFAARRLASDRSRMLALLKIEGAEGLSPATAASLADVRVGQTAVAAGRPFEPDQLVQSQGIVSALGRFGGKALQTDARVSPHHYGGALLDLSGRTLGVIVPLSPTDNGAMAGADWYDSGIGFAIPLEHVYAVLPRWAEGHDLLPGLAGFRLNSNDPLAGPPTLSEVRPGTPARRAQLRAGDEVLAIDGQPTTRVGLVQAALARRYAGETVSLTVRRDGAERTAAVDLVDAIPAYRHPLLGVLPGAEALPTGVAVGGVLNASAAQTAGLQTGDVILAVDGQPISDRAALEAALAEHVAGEDCLLGIRRAGQSLEIRAVLDEAPAEGSVLASEAAHAVAADEKPAAARPPVGRLRTGPEEGAERYELFVPESFSPGAGLGLVTLLFDKQPDLDGAPLEAWRQACREQRLALLAAWPAEEKWSPDDLTSLQTTWRALQERYKIIPARMAVCAEPQGARLASLLAFGPTAGGVRGVATVGAALSVPRRENEPQTRLWLHQLPTPTAKGKSLSDAAAALEQRGYWVTTTALESDEGLLGDAARAALVRWLAVLDRL